MYYETQLRNLQNQSELQRKLAEVSSQQQALTRVKQAPTKSKKTSQAQSLRQKVKQTAMHLRRSDIQSQLQASSISTNAILNRSRIESALQVRQRNQDLNTQRQMSFVQQCQYQNARLAAEEEVYLERDRQIQLSVIRQANTRDELYRRIREEEEERLEYERRQAETRRMVYEESARRMMYDESARRMVYEEPARRRDYIGRDLPTMQCILRRPYYF